MTDRKSHWETIYQDKSPLDVSWHQEKPDISLALIQHAALSYDAPIIDIGGGVSVLVDYLLNEGYTNISLLDISANALACARKRLGGDASNVRWYEVDVTQFYASNQFLLWHDRAVFHFLTDKSDREKYVRALTRSLRPGGQVIMAAFAIGGPVKCSGLDVVQYDADKLLAELGEGFDLMEERNEVHITPAKTEQKFMYFRFVKSA